MAGLQDVTPGPAPKLDPGRQCPNPHCRVDRPLTDDGAQGCDCDMVSVTRECGNCGNRTRMEVGTLTRRGWAGICVVTGHQRHLRVCSAACGAVVLNGLAELGVLPTQPDPALESRVRPAAEPGPVGG